MHIKSIALAAVATLALSSAVMAAEIEVQMLNKGAAGAMVFEPEVVKVAPGDTVIFKATDAGHNAETIKDMLPEGAEAFAGKMGKDISVTFDKEGVYGVKCKPHVSMGMVAVVVVGEPVNLEAVKAVKVPGKGGKKLAGLLGGL
ncbi:pseudoazurin [Roseibium suaedae]|uniref:Pseudoazurin n=1 Tax=Roseibium suaedae TaxID=735517 RepID=A0A1M7NWY4_9HYPH|nr:pseudoazurin [Roseibium suaedae]